MAMDVERQDNTMGITLAVIAGLAIVLLMLYAFGAFDNRTTTTAVDGTSTYSTPMTTPETTPATPSDTNPTTTNPDQQTTPPASQNSTTP